MILINSVIISRAIVYFLNHSDCSFASQSKPSDIKLKAQCVRISHLLNTYSEQTGCSISTEKPLTVAAVSVLAQLAVHLVVWTNFG